MLGKPAAVLTDYLMDDFVRMDANEPDRRVRILPDAENFIRAFCIWLDAYFC